FGSKADIGTQSRNVRFVPKADVNLLDDLVGAGDQRRRNGEAESCRCREIDDKFDLHRLLYRQVRGRCSLQDFIDVACCATVLVDKIGSIAHESANFDMLAITINRRHTCLCATVGNFPMTRIKGCVRRDEQTFNALRAERCEGRIKLVGSANLHRHEQDAERLGAILVSRSCGTCSWFVTLTSKPKRARWGNISRSKSICLEASISAKFARPVTLPPGCERLATNPKPTGSAPEAMTIGIALVAFRTARLAGSGVETITRGLRRTNSFAKSGSRSR